MSDLPLIITYKVENGELVLDGLVHQIHLNHFKKGLKEGDRVSAMLEVISMDGTHAQNNYFHKLCREIGHETGYQTSEIKEMMKEKAGFRVSKTTLKSAGDMTKLEMDLLIKTTIEFASTLGINLN